MKDDEFENVEPWEVFASALVGVTAREALQAHADAQAMLEEIAAEREALALRVAERCAERIVRLLVDQAETLAEGRTLRRHLALAEHNADRFAGLADVMLGVLERAGAHAAELERQVTAATRAIGAVLDQIQGDPNVRYLIGPGSDVFRRLVEAEAALTGDDADAVDATRAVARPPLAEPEVLRLRAEVAHLRALVEQRERA